MKKIAFFDIDKTIINCDSMFLFLLYGIKKRPLLSILNLFSVLFSTVLYKMKLLNVERVKEVYFYSIRFLSEKDLEQFYKTCLENKIYKDALEEMRQKSEEGYYILLVSASPTAYVKYFTNIPYVNAVIGTVLYKRDGQYINKIIGSNCKGDEKVEKINRFLKEAGMTIDYTNSCAYSDSMTDLPMFSLVENKYLINKKCKNNKNGLDELCWK